MNVPIDQAIKRAFAAKDRLEKAQENFNQAENERLAAAAEMKSAFQVLTEVVGEAMKLVASILGPGPLRSPVPEGHEWEAAIRLSESVRAQAVVASQPEGLNPPGRKPWPTPKDEGFDPRPSWRRGDPAPKFDSSAFEADPL